MLTSPKIEFEDVALGYPGRAPIISSLTTTFVGPGMLRLAGKNGSGKSTILEAISGHLPVRAGHLRVCGGEGIQGRQESVAFVRTAPALADSITMRDHCLLFGGTAESGIERISELTSALGIQEFLDHVPAQLSSGTRRKFWVALGLLRPTPVLLMDEPFNELDEESSAWLLEYLMAEAARRLVILVCHIWPSAWPLGLTQNLTGDISVTDIPLLPCNPKPGFQI